MKFKQATEQRFQFAIGVNSISSATVDADAGIIRGVTVAKAGVAAQGHFISLDANGAVTYDDALSVREMQVFTDGETLDTLMAASAVDNGRFKARSDHSDAISARAGHVTNFRRVDDRVVCDLYLNASYRDRDIVLETAKKTPELIGLSIDFIPTFEVGEDSALMRVAQLNAVDIVDRGAITPSGLFLNQKVDKTTTNKSASRPIIMDKEIEAQFSALTETLKSLTVGLAAVQATNAQLSAKLAEKPAMDDEKKKKDAEECAAKEDEKKKGAELAAQLAAVTAEVANFKKERAQLGLRDNGKDGVQAAAGSADSAAMRAADGKGGGGAEKPKTYLELMAEVKESKKLRTSDAHSLVCKAHPESYARHLQSLGVTK